MMTMIMKMINIMATKIAIKPPSLQQKGFTNAVIV